VARLSTTPLKHVLCTDIERDGALSGPNVELYKQAMARFPDIQWQASGGVRHVRDLATLASLGVAGAVSGKALLEERITPEELRKFWHDASSPASMSATARS
jgi:phosphoribosylformimino-5-aminoimidazole carboxamide ribotide isomerase